MKSTQQPQTKSKTRKGRYSLHLSAKAKRVDLAVELC